MKSKTSKKAQEELDQLAESLGKVLKKALKNDKLTVKVEKLKNKKVSPPILPDHLFPDSHFLVHEQSLHEQSHAILPAAS